MTVDNAAAPSTNLPSNTLVLSGFDRSDFPVKSVSNEQTEPAPATVPTPADETCLANQIQKLLQTTHEIPIVHWGNLKSFGRAIAVFQNVQDAAQAKLVIQNNETALGGSGKVIRARFDKHTPLYEYEHEDKHLKLPDQGRLFFISPPPSPPAGWVSIPESAPNTEVFHSDLNEALSKLASLEDGKEAGATPTSSPYDLAPFPSETVVEPTTGKLRRRVTLHQSSTKPNPPSLRLQTSVAQSETVQSKPESPSVHTPTIVVEWDDDGETDCSHMHAGAPQLSTEDKPEKMRITRTERPPM